MKEQDLDALRSAALQLFAERARFTHPVLVYSAEDVVPSTQQRLFLFAATDRDRPNEPATTVVLDEAGAPVDPASLSAREGHRLFPPVVPSPVPPEILEPRKVKIDPPRDDLTLSECDKLTETITVIIPKAGAVSKADVYFLADTTGSMEPIIASVQAGASNILTALNGLGLDLAYGVGNYKDFPNDPYAFTHQLGPTNITADVQAAINAWTVSGGGDTAEGQLFALDQLAAPPAGPIGWRPSAKRIIVWFGDAPGHDPVCAAISGLAYDITEASVTTKLVSEKIAVITISTVTGPPDALDADPVINSFDYNTQCGAPGGAAGQATRIANATGGMHVTGIDAATIVQTIIDLVQATIGSINNVSLIADPVIAPFVTSITPAGGYGPLAGDKDHVLQFTVVFTGGAVECGRKPRVFDGFLAVVVDGTAVARKPTRITVPACRFTYSVKFVCGVQPACDCACTSVRPGIYATEISIHNFNCAEAKLEKSVIPVVFAGAPAGREPRVTQRKAFDRLILPSDSVTMDDCCRIAELLLGAAPTAPLPLTIGILEITSDVELNVTAVYTASDLQSHSVSIDTETVQPRLK